MARRAGMSQVKFKVRHNTLLLREFTVADIVRATGLNPESVRTELQRMKREGLLTSRPHPDKPKRRGGRPALYRLTDNPGARLALSESIEAFYPPPPPADRPTSRHYMLAQQTLNQTQTEDDPRRRKRLLGQAERDLEMAEQAEGGSLAPESIKAYLQYERARLAYLRGEYEEARSDFEALRAFFASVHDDTTMRCVDEFLLCLKALARFSAEIPRGGVGESALARCLLDILTKESYQTDSPLILLSLELLHNLSQTADAKVRAAAFDLAEPRQREIIEMVREVLSFEQLRSFYESVTLLKGEQLPSLDLPPRDKPPPVRHNDWEFEDLVIRLPPHPHRGRKHA